MKPAVWILVDQTACFLIDITIDDSDQETVNEFCLPSLPLRRDSHLQRLAEPKPDERAKAGGAERDRTVDPLLAKQVLSQLSYSPKLAASF